MGSNVVTDSKEFKAFERVFAPLKFYVSREEVEKEIKMENIQATVIDREDGTSRNNQAFHRIKLDNGMTVYSYHVESTARLQPKTLYNFACVRRGRFLNIETFEMVIDQQDPNQEFPTGMHTTEAPFDDNSESTGGFPAQEKTIESPSPPPQAFSPRQSTNAGFAKAAPTGDKNEIGMRRGAIVHGSLGNLMGGLASNGHFNDYTPEQMVAEMIYYAKAIEHWCINGA